MSVGGPKERVSGAVDPHDRTRLAVVAGNTVHIVGVDLEGAAGPGAKPVLRLAAERPTAEGGRAGGGGAVGRSATLSALTTSTSTCILHLSQLSTIRRQCFPLRRSLLLLVINMLSENFEISEKKTFTFERKYGIMYTLNN